MNTESCICDYILIGLVAHLLGERNKPISSVVVKNEDVVEVNKLKKGLACDGSKVLSQLDNVPKDWSKKRRKLKYDMKKKHVYEALFQKLIMNGNDNKPYGYVNGAGPEANVKPYHLIFFGKDWVKQPMSRRTKEGYHINFSISDMVKYWSTKPNVVIIEADEFLTSQLCCSCCSKLQDLQDNAFSKQVQVRFCVNEKCSLNGVLVNKDLEAAICIGLNAIHQLVFGSRIKEFEMGRDKKYDDEQLEETNGGSSNGSDDRMYYKHVVTTNDNEINTPETGVKNNKSYS